MLILSHVISPVAAVADTILLICTTANCTWSQFSLRSLCHILPLRSYVTIGQLHTYQANHNVLQSYSFRIIMQDHGTITFALTTSKWWRPHSRVDRCQMIVKRVKVLQEGLGGGSKHTENLIVTRFDAELEKHLSESLQDVIWTQFWNEKEC